MTVLVLTQRLDPTADLVVRELHRRGAPIFRCDPGDFPEGMKLEAEISATGAVTGTLRQGKREVALAEIVSVYYRRPSGHRTHSRLDDGERRWAEREAEAGFGGVLAALGCPWVNHHHHNRAAAHKPHQLAAAAHAGLTVPRSLITNASTAAHAFIRRQDTAIYKAMAGGPGPGRRDGNENALYTTLIAADDVTPGVARTAHLFQAWVDKAFEVRLTVVGERLFAARIDAGSPPAHIDWRSDYRSLTYSTADPPDSVRAAVRRLMRGLHLTFAALDFVVTPEGQWVFLELNPNGQWGWIQLATGLPIASAFADHLGGPRT